MKDIKKITFYTRVHFGRVNRYLTDDCAWLIDLLGGNYISREQLNALKRHGFSIKQVIDPKIVEK